MKIVYETTIDDMVAFNRYHFTHSRYVRRLRAAWVWGTSCAIVGLGLISVVSDDPLASKVVVVAVLVVIAGLNALFQSWFYPRNLDRHTRKMYKEGKNKGVIGHRELELNDSGLVSRSEIGASMVFIEAIEKVVSNEKYVFIYMSAIMAYVIPRDAVSEGNCDQFVEALRQRISNLSPPMD
jgi:hypothetical protein